MTALKKQSLRNAATKQLPTKVIKREKDVKGLFDEILCSVGQQEVLTHWERLFECWIMSLDNGLNYKGNWIFYTIHLYIKKSFVQKDHTILTKIFYATDDEVEILEKIDNMFECHLMNIDENDLIYGQNWQMNRLCKELKQLMSLAIHDYNT